MTNAEPEAYRTSAIGPQVESSRRNEPKQSFTRAASCGTRRSMTEAWASNTELNATLPSGLTTTSGRSFGKAARFQKPKAMPPETRWLALKDERGKERPEELDSNHFLGAHPESQAASSKYASAPKSVIGTAPRGQRNDREMAHLNPSYFYGRTSPGPAAIGGDHGPDISPTRRGAQQQPQFGRETRCDSNWLKTGDTPNRVSPNSYAADRDVGVGRACFSSMRKTAPAAGFTKASRFPNDRSVRQDINRLDNARSSLGFQALGKNRKEPAFGFGTATRAVGSFLNAPADKGSSLDHAGASCRAQSVPSSPFWPSIPTLPSEREVMHGSQALVA